MIMGQVEYLEECEAAKRCPNCRSLNLSQPLDVPSQRCQRKFIIRCYSCSSTWEDKHLLVGFDNLTVGGGE